MDELHISATPNVVHDGEEIELFVDSSEPKFQNAEKAVIRVFEVDDASPIEPKPGAGKLVVTFHGKITDNTFELVPRPGGAANPEVTQVTGNGPKIKIKVDSAAADVTLPGATVEQGVFELRVQLESINPNAKKYTSDYKVFVRWFHHYKVDGQARPVITFLVVHKSDSYLTAARGFWEPNADALVEKVGMSLEEVLEVLEKESDAYGPWGQINIVMHGRARQLTGKALKGSPRFLLHRDRIDEELDGQTLPSPGGIDADTQIVFRACNAGKDASLVSKLHSEFFGGDGTLFVPKFTQVYESGGGVANEWFEESLEFDTPGDSAPPADELEAGLQAAFDALNTPGKGGTPEDEIPTFSSNHDWVQDFDLGLNVLEIETLNDDGSAKDDAGMVKVAEEAWTKQGWEKKSHTWETKPDRWKIKLESKTEDTNATINDTGWFLKVASGKGDPMVQQIQGTVGVGTSDALWTLTGAGVADQHANLSFDGSAPDVVEVEDLNSGETTKVKGADGKSFDITDGGSATVPLPATVTIGAVSISVRKGKRFELKFVARRHWVDRRRTLRLFDAARPHKDRELVKPTVGNGDHYASD